MSSALIGKNRVSEAEVIAVPEVDWTDTFHPIHHKLVISALRTSLDAFGLEVVKAEYVLASEGQKMFSVWDQQRNVRALLEPGHQEQHGQIPCVGSDLRVEGFCL